MWLRAHAGADTFFAPNEFRPMPRSKSSTPRRWSVRATRLLEASRLRQCQQQHRVRSLLRLRPLSRRVKRDDDPSCVLVRSSNIFKLMNYIALYSVSGFIRSTFKSNSQHVIRWIRNTLRMVLSLKKSNYIEYIKITEYYPNMNLHKYGSFDLINQ